MISLFKKYQVAYRCIGIMLIICMVAVMIFGWKGQWYFPFLVLIPTIILIFCSATVFTVLATKKLSKDVIILLNECQVYNFLYTVKNLFDKKVRGPNVSLYNALLAEGYAAVDDYEACYECCQKIKAKAYLFQRRKHMIEYYLKKEQLAQAEAELEEMQKQFNQIRNAKLKTDLADSVKNAEYAIRINKGDYEGAVEHYKKMLDTIKPLYPLTKVSYSCAIGRVLILKGDSESAKEYLKVAYELGGDTKYRKIAEDKLQMLNENN